MNGDNFGELREDVLPSRPASVGFSAQTRRAGPVQRPRQETAEFAPSSLTGLTKDQRDGRWRPQDAVYPWQGFLGRDLFTASLSRSRPLCPADRRASSEAALVILPFHCRSSLAYPASPPYLGSSEGQRLQRLGPVVTSSSPFTEVTRRCQIRGDDGNRARL